MINTIQKYVFKSFLTSFLLAFLVLSFVLTIGLMVQIVGYIMEGLPAGLVGRFAAVSFPETMQWTIPIALLVSSVLVFSRLSADSEIAAMRACGVSIMSVMKWPLIFGFCCTALGFVINNEVVPRGHEIRRALKSRIGINTGLDMLEPGRMNDDFPKVKLYFDSKQGNWLNGILVMDYSNTNFVRTITASKALVESEGQDVLLDLYDLTLDPVDEEHRTMAHVGRLQYRVANAFKKREYTRKEKDFDAGEMWAEIGRRKGIVADAEQGSKALKNGDPEKYKQQRQLEKAVKKGLSDIRTEFQKRMVFAMASLCFVLVGIPLGIKSQRKESSIGMAISLAVALGYYMVVILMMSFAKNYHIRPDLLIWLPVAACAIIASYLVPKNL